MARPRRAAPALIIVVLIALAAACGTGTAEEEVPAVGEADTEPTETTASPEKPDDGIPVRAELVVDGLNVPNGLADLGDGRMLISDQTGTIRVLFTEPDSEHARVDVLAEFAATGPDRDIVNPETERDLIRLEQRGTVHVGGRMVFGDDGLLYVGLATGPTGGRPGSGDAAWNGHPRRRDRDPYTVPSDNPFADGSGAPEIFAYGFRNPFRRSWDDETGLIIANPKWTEKDQDVHLATNGANAGYPLTPRQVPGSSCYDGETATTPLPECRTGPDGEDLTSPSPSPSNPPTLRDGPVAGTSGLERDATGEVYIMVIPRSLAASDGVVYRLAPPG